MRPDFVPRKSALQDHGIDLGDGFFALSPCDTGWQPVTGSEMQALNQYMIENHLEPDNDWNTCHCVMHWGCLANPNGSEVRTQWRENLKAAEDVLVAQHAEVRIEVLVLIVTEITVLR
jgi:hypothetical protein